MKETKMSAEKVVKEPKPKLMNIKLEKLHPFRSHPYKVLDDESMTELFESIKEYGFLNRIIVRPLEDKPDEYEVISGHRRVRAAELLEMKEVPAVVHFIDRDQATILMVDSNCQRENLSLICLMVAVSISVGVAAVVVMNTCASVKRKPTPLGAKFGTVIISRSMRLSCGLSENMVIFVLLVK